ncbi:hypothetical protein [Micromonospora tulbaghiae]|uniref:hypothetical protein n=1 Tax=Micromonospora tulbaghiae TaxID=479978 RepID=UPI00371E65E1
MATAAFGLIGALIGAIAALAGQLLSIRATARRQLILRLHEACAIVWMLEQEVDYAAWEALRGKVGRLDSWDFSARRKAEAEIRLLSTRNDLLNGLKALTAAGIKLSIAVSVDQSSLDHDEVKMLRIKHRDALERFENQARVAIGAPAISTASV